MTKLESIVVSNTEPNSKNVLWYDNKRLLIFSNGHWSPIVDLDDIDVDNLPGVSNLQEALKSLNIKVDNKVDKVEGKGLSTNDYTDKEKSKLSTLPTATEFDAALTAKQDKLVNSADVTVGEDDKLTVTDAVVKKAFIKRWENLSTIYIGSLRGTYDKETDLFTVMWSTKYPESKKYQPYFTYKQAMAALDAVTGPVLGQDSFAPRIPANLPPIAYNTGSGPRLAVVDADCVVYNFEIKTLILSSTGPCSVTQTMNLAAAKELQAIIGEVASESYCKENPISFSSAGPGFPKLEYFHIKIKKSFDVHTSPLLTFSTMQYLVTNAANTSPITVTVHPYVYAKLTGDTTNINPSTKITREVTVDDQIWSDEQIGFDLYCENLIFEPFDTIIIPDIINPGTNEPIRGTVDRVIDTTRKIIRVSLEKPAFNEEGELMFNTIPIGSKIMRVDRETSEEELAQWTALATTANSKNISFATPE